MAKQNTGNEPIDPRYKDMMNDVAVSLDRFFNGSGPKQNGFVLLVFPFGEHDGTRCNYISNGASVQIW